MAVIVIVLISIIVFGIIKMSISKTPKEYPTPLSPKPKEPISNTKESSLFIEDYPLLVFTEKFGSKMQIGEHKNNGKIFHTCRFIKPNGETTDVRFFSQLGELTKDQIKNRKDKLFVGKMVNGKYYLHDENVKEWEEVIL